MRTLLIVFSVFFLAILQGQVIDLTKSQYPKLGSGSGGGDKEEFKPEWLTEGRFGFNADFSSQATAEILSYRIGEQSGFNLPFYVISTVTGAGLNDASNEQITFNNLINPTGGVLNVLVAESFRLTKPIEGRTSSVSLISGIGYKLISGRGESRDSSANISTVYGDLGMRFVTGAWVANDPEIKGTFTFQAKIFYTTAIGREDQLDQIFGETTESSFSGLSIDALFYISNRIDLRINLSRPFSQQFIDENDLQRSVVTFSANYGL